MGLPVVISTVFASARDDPHVAPRGRAMAKGKHVRQRRRVKCSITTTTAASVNQAPALSPRDVQGRDGGGMRCILAELRRDLCGYELGLAAARVPSIRYRPVRTSVEQGEVGHGRHEQQEPDAPLITVRSVAAQAPRR
jgi:hypothetical protein